MAFKIAFTSVSSLVGLCLIIVMVIVSCKPKEMAEKELFSTDNIETGIYLKKSFQAKKGDLNYNILYPVGFDSEKKYPLLLFLHGAGERGNDNEAQLIHGGELIKNGANIHHFIAIFPQCPKEGYWIDVVNVENNEDKLRNIEPDVDAPASYALGMVIELMESITKEPYVDKSQVVVAGLSMGGMATFDLVWRMPNMFAAASAICGAGSTKKAKIFSDLPIRIFHGNEDQVVPVKESLEMVEALKEAGGNPEVYIYPEVNHNSWVNAFNEPDFLPWFFKHKKR